MGSNLKARNRVYIYKVSNKSNHTHFIATVNVCRVISMAICVIRRARDKSRFRHSERNFMSVCVMGNVCRLAAIDTQTSMQRRIFMCPIKMAGVPNKLSIWPKMEIERVRASASSSYNMYGRQNIDCSLSICTHLSAKYAHMEMEGERDHIYPHYLGSMCPLAVVNSMMGLCVYGPNENDYLFAVQISHSHI